MKDKLTETHQEGYQSWFFPEVSSPNTLPSAEKEEKDKQALDKEIESVEETIESVEDVEQDITELISAEHLQEIAEEAEREGYQAGFDKGTQEGFESGHKEGLLLAKKDSDELMQRLHNLTEALLIPLKNEQEHLEKVIVKLVSQLVESIVGKVLGEQSSVIIESVKKCLLALPHMTDHLTLYLNSQDHKLIKDSNILAEYDCHIVDDDQLMLGGCRLVSSDSSIDYTIETRLKLLIDEFVNQPLGQQVQDIELQTKQTQELPAEPSPITAPPTSKPNDDSDSQIASEESK